MKFAFAALSGVPDAPALVCCVYAERALGPTAAALDAATGGALTRAMEAGKFSGKAEETLTLLAPAGLPGTRRVVLLGLGKAGEITALTAQKAGGAMVAALEKTGDAEIQLALDDMPDAALSSATLAAEMAFGGRLRSYRFDKYRTQEKPDSKPTLKKLTIRCAAPDDAKAALAARDPVSDAVIFARDLVSEPANVVYPETLAERCKALEELGIKLEVLEPKKLRKLGMGALLGVAQGSPMSRGWW